MRQWHPAPRAMIDDELARRWTKDNPAPDLVVHMVLCARIDQGAPWGRTKLMQWSGLSRYHAQRAIDRARDWMAEWQQSANVQRTSPPNGTQYATITNGYGVESADNLPQKSQNLPSRARSSSTRTDTHTGIDIHVGQEPDTKPKEGKKAKNIGTAESRERWQRLNDRRKKGRQGAKNMKLTPPIAADLREGLRYATADEILHAYEYFLTSLDNRWWQDNDCDLDTFIRRKHLGSFVSKAAEWDSDIEKDKLRALTEMPF